MDESEKLVEAYLRGIGFTDVQYEPDGNVPPDFLINGRVAVEVRRLNQNYDDGTGKGLRGLEEVSIPLWFKMRKYLQGLGASPSTGTSWYVLYRLERPLARWSKLRADLDVLLKAFMSDANPQPFEKALNGGLTINVFRCPIPKATFFVAAGESDEQSGGWLLGEIASNLKYCIDEKAAKIAPFQHKYPEWWLVLPDYIGFGLDDFGRELFLDQVVVAPSIFTRVILIDPRDASRAMTVVPTPAPAGAIR